MRIKSLEKVRKVNNLYDLYTTVISNDVEYGIYKFFCTDRHNMRIDLICLDIYENTDEIDIICKINGIINPLTVQSGDVILFIDPDNIDDVRTTDNIMLDILDQIKDANKGKELKIDKNRVKDLRNRENNERNKKLLPLHLLDANKKNVTTQNGMIKRGPNF